MIHVLDASRSVTVVGALLSNRKADYVEVSRQIRLTLIPWTRGYGTEDYGYQLDVKAVLSKT